MAATEDTVPMSNVGWAIVIESGTTAIVWGTETFGEHRADASKRLGVTAFALALLLAGAEPEELATVVTASLRYIGGVAFGDVIGPNAAIVTVALGVGARIATVPFGRDARRYALGGCSPHRSRGVRRGTGEPGESKG